VEKVSFLDGCKLYLDGGWIIIRFSGTEPRVRIFAEAETAILAESLVRLAAEHIGLPFPPEGV
jgi:phosphomannomutase